MRKVTLYLPLQKRVMVVRLGLHLAWAIEHLHAHDFWSPLTSQPYTLNPDRAL